MQTWENSQIEHEIDRHRFSTIGVHANIIEASWQALVDAIDYAVARH